MGFIAVQYLLQAGSSGGKLRNRGKFRQEQSVLPDAKWERMRADARSGEAEFQYADGQNSYLNEEDQRSLKWLKMS